MIGITEVSEMRVDFCWLWCHHEHKPVGIRYFIGSNVEIRTQECLDLDSRLG